MIGDAPLLTRLKAASVGAATPREEIGAQAESALRTIRTVLGVMACLVLASLRPESNQSTVPRIALTIGAIVVATIGLNLLSTRAPKHTAWQSISQMADTLAVVGLVIALDAPLAHQAWVLMIIPMVSATVRQGAFATLATWIASSGLFVVAVVVGAVAGFEDRALLIRIPGLLLAVAIAASVLARWMREGWELQNTLTDSIATRERRLATIENTTQALHRLGSSEALEVCATAALEIGFDAATVTHDSNVEFAVGSADVIADQSKELEADEPTVTAWVADEQEYVFSVSIPEPESGRTVVAWSTTAPTEDQVQALGTLVAHTSTAIETQTLLESLRYASDHDALTDLLNRRGVDTALDEAGKLDSLAVAFVDLDDLKKINDQYGHDAGDQAICAVADQLTMAAGANALVARFGGDEFVIAIPGGTLEDISAVAIDVLDALVEPITLQDLDLKLGVSIGVASDSDPVDASKVLSRADEAVYKAKALGKGKLVALESKGRFRAVKDGKITGPAL